MVWGRWKRWKKNFVGFTSPEVSLGWGHKLWRFGLEDHFPFFSWVMAVGEPAVKSSRV